MIIYVLIAAFVGGLAVGGGGVNWWKEAQITRAEKAQAKAEAVVEAAAEEAEQEAANKVIDMTAAFDAGEANAKTVTRTIYVKGQQLVAATPAFANPACVIGNDGLQLVNSARAGVQLAANTAAVDGGVPATGPTAGRQNGDAVPSTATGRGPVPAVQPQTGSTGSGGGVPAGSARGVPTNPLTAK